MGGGCGLGGWRGSCWPVSPAIAKTTPVGVWTDTDSLVGPSWDLNSGQQHGDYQARVGDSCSLHGGGGGGDDDDDDDGGAATATSSQARPASRERPIAGIVMCAAVAASTVSGRRVESSSRLLQCARSVGAGGESHAVNLLGQRRASSSKKYSERALL